MDFVCLLQSPSGHVRVAIIARGPTQVRQYPRKIFKEDADHACTLEESGLTNAREMLLYSTVECE